MTSQDSLRSDFLTSLVGKPWVANARGPEAYDCWHLVAHIQQELFRIGVPDVDVPDSPSWRWMIDQFTLHAEKANWKEIPYSTSKPITAKDGAIVLMARNSNPAHCGVWLRQESRVIHADQAFGVIVQDIMTLRVSGWAKLRFYERE